MSLCHLIDHSARWTAPAIANLALFLTLQFNYCSAQQFGFPIQLPTTSGFSANTTVSVPDGGAISLGGNSGSAWSSTRSGGLFRPFGNRAIGGTQFASNASVHVQIISLAEMEAELLSQLPSDRSLEDYARPQAPGLTIHQAINSTTSPSKLPRHPSVHTASTAESRSNPETIAAQRRLRQAAESPAEPNTQSKFSSEVVDPNGSKQVQDKADFMSRHIGRKKK